MTLETRAMAWMRYEKRCPLVLHERTPCGLCGRPDVIGVTKARYTVEMEIKRSMADFRANAQKPHVKGRDSLLRFRPRQFWYLVPASLIDAAQAELPEWAGLATEAGANWLQVVKPSPVNSQSRRVPVKDAIRWVELQSNQLWAAERDLDAAHSRRNCDAPPWMEYQI